MEVINQHLFLYINGLSRHSVVLDTFFVWCSSSFVFYSMLIVASIGPGILFFKTKSQHHYALAKVWLEYILSILFTGIVVAVLKYTVAEPRPFQILQNVHMLLPYGSFDSFPSLHAAFSFAIAVTTVGWSKKWGTVALIAAVLISFSRIYVGEHFPLDVVTGALIGTVIAWLFRSFFKNHVD